MNLKKYFQKSLYHKIQRQRDDSLQIKVENILLLVLVVLSLVVVPIYLLLTTLILSKTHLAKLLWIMLTSGILVALDNVYNLADLLLLL
jgi:hypothetical protein